MNKYIKDEVYDRINQKFEKGIFTKGNEVSLCITVNRETSKKKIYEIPENQRTPELCIYLMEQQDYDIGFVPQSSRTRQFFIYCFTNSSVANYIKENIENFDRQFFKDLIVSNKHSTFFSSDYMSFPANCFEIMPLEYIDEEMCSLAILYDNNYASKWFETVYKRKPEVLTEDLWKLGARFYSMIREEKCEFLDITPDDYKDTEYYKELCCSTYNGSIELHDLKGKIMNVIPKEILTPEFLLELLENNMQNIAMFSEDALETEISYLDGKNIITEKIWQFAIKRNGKLIRLIDLNDERNTFFLNHYDKDSDEYIWSFKEKYKEYKKEKENNKAYEEAQKRAYENRKSSAQKMLFNALLYSLEDEDSTKAITDENENMNNIPSVLIPINYYGSVPKEFCKEYDSEEYLKMMYEDMGIQIVREYDDLFYEVILPEGWSVETKYYLNTVKDAFNNPVFDFSYQGKFYDRYAYVKNIFVLPNSYADICQTQLKKHC